MKAGSDSEKTIFSLLSRDYKLVQFLNPSQLEPLKNDDLHTLLGKQQHAKHKPADPFTWRGTITQHSKISTSNT